jgi:hypothetical protein
MINKGKYFSKHPININSKWIFKISEKWYIGLIVQTLEDYI